MAGSFSLPNPTSPGTGDALTSLPVRQNFQAIQTQINNFDGAALNTKSVTENALADPINPRLFRTQTNVNVIVSGLNPSVPGSGLVITIPAGTAYVNGNLIVYPGGNITVAANQDTYLDISTVGAITQVAVANNATVGMTLTANSLRFAKVVANANVVQILQGTFNTAPVSPNTSNWFGFDPLGNPVYNLSPYPTTIGYVQLIANVAVTGAGPLQATGLTLPVIVTGRRVKLTLTMFNLTTSAAGQNVSATVWDGVVGSGTQLTGVNEITGGSSLMTQVEVTPTAGTKTYNVGLSGGAGSTLTLVASATAPALFKAELV